AVEIEAGPARRHAMEGGIDIVRAALEGLHGKAAARQCSHQPQRHCRLAGARAHGGDNDATRAHRQPTRPASSCWRSPAMAPITTMAGEPMPASRASATSFARVLSTTRSLSVV